MICRNMTCFKLLKHVLNYVVSDTHAELVFNDINSLMQGTFSELVRSFLWINPSEEVSHSSLTQMPK